MSPAVGSISWAKKPTRLYGTEAPVAFLLTDDGSWVTGGESIVNAFAVYSADPLSTRADLLQFIADLPMPRLTPEKRESLEANELGHATSYVEP
ncbi:hypothetical protein NDU88_006107 [Pleurodeles waltl]|uniref:Uncharacterized protein n=1 Tax=Pleurodeles waltl TaxID=8319 RepID=A0AAV7QI38_PLEWA|nr:hypothetical protein NDU88_006107 [Pleurodeles waltl]